MTTTIRGVAGLRERVGQHLGYSDWHEVTQERVDRFADATDDHQWIHVDVERAAAGPFGGPIAHGFLTLSLASALLPEVLRVEGISMGVNYGLNRVRFPAPVPVGSRIRVGAELASVEEIPGGAQVTVAATFEVEARGSGAPAGTPADKPCCVAEILFRYYE